MRRSSRNHGPAPPSPQSGGEHRRGRRKTAAGRRRRKGRGVSSYRVRGGGTNSPLRANQCFACDGNSGARTEERSMVEYGKDPGKKALYHSEHHRERKRAKNKSIGGTENPDCLINPRGGIVQKGKSLPHRRQERRPRGRAHRHRQRQRRGRNGKRFGRAHNTTRMRKGKEGFVGRKKGEKQLSLSMQG